MRVCPSRSTGIHVFFNLVHGARIFNVGTVADRPNIHNILTNIGHRFGHQSGLDGNTRQKPFCVVREIVLRVCLVFSEMGKNITR